MDLNKKVPKGTKKIIEMICELEPQEFIGVCKILGVEIFELRNEEESEQVLAAEPTLEKTELNLEITETSDGRETSAENQKRNTNVIVRPSEVLIEEVFDKIFALNRTQRRNFQRLLHEATRGK